MKRISLHITFTICCVAGGSSTATHAQTSPWPQKPVRLLVASGPGSGDDEVARIVGPKVGEKLGQPLLIQYRAGAGGVIGQLAARESAPDGYTFLLAGGSMAGAA